MAITPFHSVPRAAFFFRMLVPALLVVWLGVALMGVLADRQIFQPVPVKSNTGGLDSTTLAFESLSSGGINHWRTVYFFSTHIPEVCWADQAVNDFQKRQCAEFWEHLKTAGALSFLPFFLLFVFFGGASGSLQRVYRQARKKIQAAKPIFKGVVTDPAEASADIFSRVYCLRPLSVQLPQGAQIKVYLPLDAVIPRPGETMAVFEPLQAFGQKRHFAILYAPHIAVVSGVRR